MMNDIFLPQRAELESNDDGVLLLRSPCPLRSGAEKTGDWLDQWAGATPSSLFIAERSGDGWRSVTYAAALDKVQALASSLLGLGLSQHKPLMLLSGKSIDHALLVLAAQYVGIVSVTIAEQYSLVAAAHDKLRHALSVVKPGAIFVDDSDRFAAAFESGLLKGIPLITSQGVSSLTLSNLVKGDSSVDIDNAKSRVTGDTLAKLLFTSGSTSLPKAVRTTHRMLTANQAQIGQVWPFLERRPQRIVDWLPWNHTFGGSHNFNLMLANGGTLYIDDGQPTEKGIAKTIENIRLVGQTVSFNVPIAFSMMAKAMQKDKALRARFFQNLDLVFYAAASMPQTIWDDLKQLSIEQTGSAPEMSASWGMTETAPAALMVHGPMKKAGAIGVPLPGLIAKLLPISDETFELRVTGPNVTDGYYNDPEKTAESFDEQGYLITGDVVRFVDPEQPSAGLLFDGRIAEDFKLMTGTWVQVSKVRTAAVSALSPVVKDLVICGHNKYEVGALAFIDPAFRTSIASELQVIDGLLQSPKLQASLAEGLQRFAGKGGGSSMRIARIMAVAQNPSFEHGEITQKGNLNQKLLLKTHAELVERLFDDSDPAVTKLIRE